MNLPRTHPPDLDRPTDGHGALPLLPAVIAELERTASGRVRRHRLSLLAHADPALCARLMAATRWGLGSRLSIHACIGQCSNEDLKVLARAMLRDAEESARTLAFLGESGLALWTHSVETAVVARFLSEELWFGRASFEEVYLVGLLHDLGRFVLATGSPDLVHEVDETRWQTPLSLLAAERELVGQDHAELGFLHALELGLPDRLAHLILRHHDYEPVGSELMDPQESELLACVQMADFFSVMMTVKPHLLDLPEASLAEEIAVRCVHPSWPAAPVREEVLARMVPRIRTEVEEYLEALGLAHAEPAAPSAVPAWLIQVDPPDASPSERL